MTYDVVTIGDCYEDIFLLPSKASILENRSFNSGKGLCFGYGDKIALKSITYHIGGSAANTAVNFSKIGLSASLISSVGSDSQGDKILKYLQQKSIDISNIKKKNSSASNMSVIFRYLDDRTIFTFHGDRDPLDYIPKKTLKTRWIYLAPFGGDTTIIENRIIEIIARNGTGLIWNPGNRQLDKKARNFVHLLHLCNIIVLNKEELNRFVDLPGKNSLEDSMKKLHKYGVKLVVVTDGGKGAWCYDGQLFYKIDPMDVNNIDATGAGDSFASSFAAKIILSSEGKAQGFQASREIIDQALKWGVIVSGSVVSIVGAHEGVLSISEIEQRERKLVKLNSQVYTI